MIPGRWTALSDTSVGAAVPALAQRTAAELGGIDVLVNNAAIYAGYVHYTMMELPLDY
jgi:NAD(P)-dependent dehydrogenase (short-subunit alcohol dehydrogenase family)